MTTNLFKIHLSGRPPITHGGTGSLTELRVSTAHTLFKVDRILMKEPYYSAIIGGVSACKFPPVPVDYGYRDSTNFWCSSFRRPFSVKIKAHEGDVKSVIYCAERIDPEIKFTTEACAKLKKIPRVFLKAALTQMADIAKECEIKVIDEQALEIINQKRKARRK